jgi:hypothetical protein
MTRTLACLVASMTAGAVFLDWMKPLQSTSASSGIKLMARGPIERVWEGIDIEVCPSDDRITPKGSHFRVYRNGDWDQTEHWLAQKSLGPRAVVHIALLAAGGPEAVTPAQRSTAEDLARRLHEQCGIPSGQTPLP